MPQEIQIPNVGESITEVMIAKWLKQEGDLVEKDDPVAEIETDKATLELPSPIRGIVTSILKEENEWVAVGETVAIVEETDSGTGSSSEQPASKASSPAPDRGSSRSEEGESPVAMPSARHLIERKGLSPSEIEGSGKGGRILKEDVLEYLEGEGGTGQGESQSSRSEWRQEEVVPMSPLRRTVARRLVEAQSNAALLTTFNEVDMSEVIELRRRYRQVFEERHEIRLGFMSFFVKATIEALKRFPALNAQIDGNDIRYHNYFDIGIAVSSSKGLVVPILRNAESLSFAEIEKRIHDFGVRGKENRIELHELEGGTFTISNGGVFGSLLSTPIVNPPQSGVLGLHAIKDRPVAVDGEVVVRPMMYLALTYDHRLVDGREAVTFLKIVKEIVEDPVRLLLEIES